MHAYSEGFWNPMTLLFTFFEEKGSENILKCLKSEIFNKSLDCSVKEQGRSPTNVSPDEFPTSL